MVVVPEERSRQCGRMYFVYEALNTLFQQHARAAGITQGMCLQPSLLTDNFRIACRVEYINNACDVLSRQRFNRTFSGVAFDQG